MTIKIIINGTEKDISISEGELLLEVLRRKGYKGVKKGCLSGECGACTVLLDGRPVNSCLVLAADVNGRQITTIEGLGTPEKPHMLQRIFVQAGAVQCGYCTPGMILSTKALLDKNPKPSESQIKKALDGNFCRCTGYVKIIDAVKTASRKLKKKR
ncbi:MAG: (2Fe-2S)-binding protein [Spirochaetes bacterium]|nr:(2Fe-2S)-binding protein [Spirochaetota bacterium]